MAIEIPPDTQDIEIRMRTLTDFTVENHPELKNDIYVPANTECKFLGWNFNEACVSGIEIRLDFPDLLSRPPYSMDRGIEVACCASLIFSSTATLSEIASQVKQGV